MILSLEIKNVALIESLQLNFFEGLNVMSGETGAGKSIIIDSLGFVLGDRADKSLIRHGENAASVKVVFDISKNLLVREELKEAGIVCEEGEDLILSRTMTENGRSECRINFGLVNLSLLRRIVRLLVDIHSQNEHQSLINENSHIDIIDSYTNDSLEMKEKLSETLKRYKEIKNELSSLPSEGEREKVKDILSFQIEEIKKADIKSGEEEELLKKRAYIMNSQRIIDALTSALDFLEGRESGLGALQALHSANKEMMSVSKYLEDLISLSERIESSKIEVQDISDSVKELLDGFNFDSLEEGRIEERLQTIRKIKTKYGKSLDEIEVFLDKAEKELLRVENAEEIAKELIEKVRKEEAVIVSLSKALNEKRRKAAAHFEERIEKNLIDLGMPSAMFKTEISFPDSDDEIIKKASATGADRVVFMITPNKGEPLKPLSKIASGGEMSRFMLALKNITAEYQGIPTLIFDEIDTGISGNIAFVVAQKLSDIAFSRQVIAVTHLPQLAAMADKHYLIEKKEDEIKTHTFIKLLSEEESIDELMRLTGSTKSSDAGRAHAGEMKKSADLYKKKSRIS